MNKLTIIGNLTKNPELRTTSSGISVCSFTVAVNRRRRQEGHPEADFFNVTAWRERGEMCAKFLQKGNKVCVVGAVSVRTWEKDGRHGASLEIPSAEEIEFLSPRVSDPEQAPAPVYKSHDDGIIAEDGYSSEPETGYGVFDTDELPF